MTSKIIFMGDGGVGKTSLIKRYLGKSLSSRITLGVDFHSLELNSLRIIIWDLSGQDRFKYLLDSFVLGANIAVLVFDLSRPRTLIRLENWLKLLESKCSSIKIILVGNKKDLGKNIDNDLIMNLINKINEKYIFVGYIETSAYNGENVDRLFMLIREALDNKKKKVIDNIKIMT